MKKSLDCPFCNKTFPITNDTYTEYNLSYESANWKYFKNKDENGVEYYKLASESDITINFYKCPACEQFTIDILGKGPQFPNDFQRRFYPSSEAKQFPDYVPASILEDYQEAYDILRLSPKSSATLSRRCIQGMIRD